MRCLALTFSALAFMTTVAGAACQNAASITDPCTSAGEVDLGTTTSIPGNRSAATTGIGMGNRVVLGVYDPHRAFSNDRDVGIEHIFVYWQALDLEEFRQRLSQAEKLGRTMMVTVEPYTRAVNWRDGGEHLFADIIAGRFGPEIEQICGELGRYRGKVLIRWGHEMEDPTGRYPWARKDADGYKTAFRHFVTSCRKLAPRAAFVWSPKGEKNLNRYYPGGAYVDYVGLSVWGLQKLDLDHYGRNRQFEMTFMEKYNRVAGFAKPVIIAELGVSGDRDYRVNWFDNLYSTIARSPAFRQLQAVVYFNDKEPAEWPMGYGSPDWRIGADWFSRAKQVAYEARPTLQ